MKMGMKLILAFVSIAAVCAVVGGVGVYGLRVTSGGIHEIGVIRLPSVQGLLVLESGAVDVRAMNNELMLPHIAAADRPVQFERMDHAWATVERGWKIYEPLPQTAAEAHKWEEFVGVFDEWKKLARGITEAVREYTQAEPGSEQAKQAYATAETRHRAITPVYRQMTGLLAELVELNVQIASDVVVESQGAASRATWLAALSVVIGVVIAITVGLLFSRRLLGVILPVVDRAKAIAAGDLTGQRLVVRSKDELGTLTTSVNQMSDALVDLVGSVSSSASEVASAATQIASSSEEIAAGMKEQTEQVTQVSSAIEEMSQSIVEVAKKAGEAANQANHSGKLATEGGEVVGQTIEGMNAISDAVNAGAQSVTELGKRGAQIGQIIEVINDIADQTNLLALNAAIEAARAGEHGRGFAVVADEVRKLADRTTKATDEIAQSITAIQSETGEAVQRMNAGTQQVEVGVEKATAAGASLKQIVGGAQEVASMIGSIAAAAEEQSAASEQVSRNIESISAVTKQASEGSGQAAAAATQLSSKAEQLLELVGRFRLRDERSKADAAHAA